MISYAAIRPPVFFLQRPWEMTAMIEVESLDAAHAYLMATPTGSPWEVAP